MTYNLGYSLEIIYSIFDTFRKALYLTESSIQDILFYQNEHRENLSSTCEELKKISTNFLRETNIVKKFNIIEEFLISDEPNPFFQKLSRFDYQYYEEEIGKHCEYPTVLEEYINKTQEIQKSTQTNQNKIRGKRYLDLIKTIQNYDGLSDLIDIQKNTKLLLNLYNPPLVFTPEEKGNLEQMAILYNAYYNLHTQYRILLGLLQQLSMKKLEYEKYLRNKIKLRKEKIQDYKAILHQEEEMLNEEISIYTHFIGPYKD